MSYELKSHYNGMRHVFRIYIVIALAHGVYYNRSEIVSSEWIYMIY